MAESNIILKTILIAMAFSCFTFPTGNLAFSSDEIIVNVKEHVFVKVFGGPVGFYFYGIIEGKCAVHSSHHQVLDIIVPVGEKKIIKVLGDDDIVIECLGTKGIKIKKD